MNFVLKKIKATNDIVAPDINIAFSVDGNYIDYSGVTIFSIIKNNLDLKIKFHIFTSDKTIKNKEKFELLEKKYQNISINFYILNKDLYKDFQINAHFNDAIYYRLSIIETLKDTEISNVLYLDADILCLNSLSELLNKDLSTYPLAAVKDIKSQDCLNNLNLNGMTNSYFNSGVMFINIEKWVKENTFNQFINIITQKKYQYPDQDVLNIIFCNKVLFIDKKFNYVCSENKDAVLIHYTGPIKPWSLDHSWNQIYLDYLYESPWNDLTISIPQGYKRAKKYSIFLFRKKQYKDSFYWFLLYLSRKLKEKALKYINI